VQKNQHFSLAIDGTIITFMQISEHKEFNNKKIALVLSGGVVKAAAWHLGVSLALEELGFSFKSNSTVTGDPLISTYVGSSAGSIINSYFASGFKPMDVVEATLDGTHARLKPITYKEMLSLKKPNKKSRRSNLYDPLDGFPLFLKKVFNPILDLDGFFTTQGLHDYFEGHVLPSNRFEDFESDLFIVATQLDNSRKVIFSKYNFPSPAHDSTSNYYTGIPISQAIAASTAVPPFYCPYPIFNPQTQKTDYYIDGEIRDTLSTHVAHDNKCDLIISSWTHTPYHYNDEIGSLANYGLPAICTQAIYLLIQKKIVSHRAQRLAHIDVLNTVHEYLKDNKFSPRQTRELLSILESKLNINPNVTLIDIYPQHQNFKTFFRNSFSLNQAKTSELVTSGYKRAIEVFRKHQW
jgi:predicted acylesterase/phospholipase RssA